jgi:hypothetical protein
MENFAASNRSMKILLAADLHFRSRWFHWLFDQGVNFDLICIAGDLLDMFSGEPRLAQAREVTRWIREIGKGTQAAVCSSLEKMDTEKCLRFMRLAQKTLLRSRS